ncbi:MAG TPA: protein-methionine-sulfoxide reductase catalytic subunit MsrP [Thermoanaerobaculia bacterium]|nr:protein-methionine-sulfoxide reductase catalytic subunit MsrP [Thermoanaerobaculia bacterium]
MPRPFLPVVERLEPTPREVFFNRRRFISALGLGALAVRAGVAQGEGERQPIEVPFQRPGVFPPKRNEAYALPEGLATHLTPREKAATHNNFYEFLPGRGGPAWQFTEAFEVDPWKVEVVGECAKPATFDLDALFAFPHEERLYHFRCVERWAMNVPWSGFPLSKLLARVEPTAGAKYVRFVSAHLPDQMPGLAQSSWYPWPYHEALRMDEAMNELAMVVTGVYGEPLLKQHGAPVRIVVPWKYGYKNPKSIVRIELVSEEPKTFWQVQPHEYGFLSNVNPHIPHPRWSQAESYWLDSGDRFPTPIFNGYGSSVAALYPDEPTTPQKPLGQGQIAR